MCVYSLMCTVRKAELKNIAVTSGTKTCVIECSKKKKKTLKLCFE